MTRQKTCKHCKTKFIPTRPMAIVCSWECGREYIQTQAKKAERKQDRAKRERLKTRSDWIKEAQQAFNAYIRERDRVAGHLCISSGLPLDWTGNNVDCGHYRSVGSAPHLRFTETNAHAQSKKENRWLSGSAVNYRIGLIKRIGLAEVERLEADNTPKKWTVEELKAIRDEYRMKLKQLKESAND